MRRGFKLQTLSSFFFLSIATILIIVVSPLFSNSFFYSQYAFGEEGMTELTWKNEEYAIGYTITNSSGRVENIALRDLNMRVMLSGNDVDGTLVLELPMKLAKSVFGFGKDSLDFESFVIFVDGEEPADYGIVAPSCNSLAIQIALSEGAEQVDIAASTMPGGSGSELSKGIEVTPTLKLEEGNFQLSMITNAEKCDISLIKEQKKLHIDVEHDKGEQGFIEVVIPHRLLGGEYSVLINGQTSTDFNATYNQATEDSTTLSIKYDGGNVKSIDVTGTTVIPEFGLLSAAVFAAAMVAIIVAASQIKAKNKL